jgi:hypothetical protein
MYYQTYVMQKNTYPTGRDSVDNSYSGVATFGPRVDELPPTNSVPPALRGRTFIYVYEQDFVGYVINDLSCSAVHYPDHQASSVLE